MRMMNARNNSRQNGFRSVSTRRVVLLSTMMAALAVAGFLAVGSMARGATQSKASVSLRKTSLGAVLVNSKGHTLYLFAKDKRGKSACSGRCAKFWPPLLIRSKATAGSGVKISLLGTTRRSNGALQVTYNKHPLYAYVLDKRAGQTTGEGISIFGAKWWAISARGTAVLKAPAPGTTTGMTTTTNPYP